MYSTFTSSTDTDAVDEGSFIFNHAHDSLLSMPIAHESAHEKIPAPHTIPISGLNNLVYGQYDESTPSSIHYGDTQETSETNGSHISVREDRDGSTSSGYINGQDCSHAPSPLHYPHPILNARRNVASIGAKSTTPANFNGDQPAARALNGTDSQSAVDTGSGPIKHVKQSSDIAPKPTDLKSPGKAAPRVGTMSRTTAHDHSRPLSTPETSTPIKGKGLEFRANSSIPAAMSWEEFARQSILAAESSRLNPFSLHPEEYELLRNHITHAQVTVYLNIRNAILRLWTKSPLVAVTAEEAAGCVREKRYFGLAIVAYHWLMRKGYINFGCVEVPDNTGSILRRTPKGGQRTILVIGAGMSGLGCARHLEGLSAQFGDQWTKVGERPPKVIVLEARPRVGGRVYSHPLRDQSKSGLPPGHRCTAEMGAQIVTGFEHGNPMNALIRGQLGIRYHGLRDNTVLYDHDGTIVERGQDILVEKLYNDVLERASIYRNKPAIFRTVEGDRNLIIFGRDPNDTGGPTIAELEKSNAPLPADASTTASTTEEKPSSGVEKLAGRAYQLTAGFNPNVSAAEAAMTMGWRLRTGASLGHSLELDTTAKSSDHPTLGQIMDEGIKQYQSMLELGPKDLRLLNWHHANLEYANAVNVNQLSLSGWDQDIGNEFEGEHTEIIGGYQQVPRGLWQCPKKLDVRFNSVVKSVQYKSQEQKVGKAARVECHNGDVFEVDRIVLTTPLGVLKSGSITFEPRLPDWKEGVIERMGFGLLNKVVLVYEEAFWEPDRDMFGLLNEAEQRESVDPKDYAAGRGRFYLFWNCIKTSGKPTLIALMAGEAAHYAESSSDERLVEEVTGRLTRMFAPKSVPLPLESIVTRWSKDPFARGSYSYVGPRTQAGDYDVMAKPHGPIHFAGEATCGTHPATVHGAYLSGLRAAGEVVESMIGPIEVPIPLVEKRIKLEHPPPVASLDPKHRVETDVSWNDNRTSHHVGDKDYEATMFGAMLADAGDFGGGKRMRRI